MVDKKYQISKALLLRAALAFLLQSARKGLMKARLSRFPSLFYICADFDGLFWVVVAKNYDGDCILMTKWTFLRSHVSHVKAHIESFLILSLQLIASYHPGKSQYSTALRVANQPKNRSPDLLSTDSARVFLNPGGEMDGDDYINASWLMGK